MQHKLIYMKLKNKQNYDRVQDSGDFWQASHWQGQAVVGRWVLDAGNILYLGGDYMGVWKYKGSFSCMLNNYTPHCLNVTPHFKK